MRAWTDAGADVVVLDRDDDGRVSLRGARRRAGQARRAGGAARGRRHPRVERGPRRPGRPRRRSTSRRCSWAARTHPRCSPGRASRRSTGRCGCTRRASRRSIGDIEGGGRCSRASLRSWVPCGLSTVHRLVVDCTHRQGRQHDRRVGRRQRRVPHRGRTRRPRIGVRPVRGDPGPHAPAPADRGGSGQPRAPRHAGGASRRAPRAGPRRRRGRGGLHGARRRAAASWLRVRSPRRCAATRSRRGRSRSTA